MELLILNVIPSGFEPSEIKPDYQSVIFLTPKRLTYCSSKRSIRLYSFGSLKIQIQY